jgi:site-specific DNA-methyltransferase (adenine-specific)
MGSGTTAIAALMEQRQFIGIEIVPEYAQLAQQRVAEYLSNRQETLCF